MSQKLFVLEDERRFQVNDQYQEFISHHSLLKIRFAYGYLSPNVRVRLHLNWDDTDLNQNSITNAFLDKKLKLRGVQHKRSIPLSVETALFLYSDAPCTLSKFRYKFLNSKDGVIWSLDLAARESNPYSSEAEPSVKGHFLPEIKYFPDFVGEEITTNFFTYELALKYNNGPKILGA